MGEHFFFFSKKQQRRDNTESYSFGTFVSETFIVIKLLLSGNIEYVSMLFTQPYLSSRLSPFRSFPINFVSLCSR